MYIHSYQVNNVLDAYRKKLSQTPENNGHQRPSEPKHLSQDRINLSMNGQLQTIMEKVSDEIVDRITQVDSQKSFQKTLAKHLNHPSMKSTGQPLRKEIEFTYTLIDENNRKTTNTLLVESFNPLVGKLNRTPQESVDE